MVKSTLANLAPYEEKKKVGSFQRAPPPHDGEIVNLGSQLDWTPKQLRAKLLRAVAKYFLDLVTWSGEAHSR